MGKRQRVDEEQQQPDYEADREPAPYCYGGSGQRSDGSGSRCDPELVSYLTEVSQHASSLSDREERQLLLANVLEEISGREVRVATDAVTSRLLESLLAGAPAQQLMQFMAAFTNEDMMFQLAGGAFGSHVAEKVLAGLHQQAEQLMAAEGDQGAAAAADEDAEDGSGAAAAAGTLEGLLGSMVGAIGGHLFDYIMDKHATHVARALLVVIAGRDVLSPVSKKKKHEQQHGEGEEGLQGAAEGRKANQQAFKPGRSSLQQKMEGSTPAAAAGQQQQQGVRFPALLRRFAKMLPLYDAANMQLLGKNNYSGPFIQAVLRAAAGDKELLQLLLPPILGVDAAKAAAAAPGEVLSTLTDSHVGRLLRDECYSHLLEAAAAVMPAELRSEFYSRFLKGRLQPLANHHSANFVVQAWMAACSTPQQVQEVITELQAHLPDLLKRRRSGVAAAFVAAAGRAGGPAQQAAAVAALANALSALAQWQGREGTDHLAPALLTLDSNATMGGSSSAPQQQQQHYNSHYAYGGGGSRLSTPGSAILATLLTHYNKKAAKPFAASMAALSAADAARAAKDPAGSRALQAFVEGGVAGTAAKAALLSKLSGCWGDVALQAAGSFFLEKAYAWADLEQKESIVKEVAARQSSLMAGCHWGPLLARKLALDSYTRSPDEWRKRAASTAAAKRAFEQLLSDDTPAAAAAAAATAASADEDAAGPGKKRKRQQQQQQVDAAAGAAAGGASSSKREKKRARLAAAAAAADAGGPVAAAPPAAATEAAAERTKRKKRKHPEDGGDAGAAAAAAAAAGVGASPGSDDAVKHKQKKKKDKSANTAAAAAGDVSGKSSSKRKRQSAGAADGGSGAAVAGSTDDFVALLGFGGLGAGEQKQSGKRHRKA